MTAAPISDQHSPTMSQVYGAGYPQCRPRADCDGCAYLRPTFLPCVTGLRRPGAHSADQGPSVSSAPASGPWLTPSLRGSGVGRPQCWLRPTVSAARIPLPFFCSPPSRLSPSPLLPTPDRHLFLSSSHVGPLLASDLCWPQPSRSGRWPVAARRACPACRVGDVATGDVISTPGVTPCPPCPGAKLWRTLCVQVS